MPLDPQIAAMLGAAQWPAARSVPVAELRARINQATGMLGKLDVPLAGTRDDVIPGPGGPLAIRVYTPQGAGPFPLVLFFHGGGFVVGNLDTQDPIARGLASGAQAVVVSVDYRLAPEAPFPAAAHDALAATRWVAANAEGLNGDARRIAVAGDSAGAVLSAGVAISARDKGGPALSAQVLLYGTGNYPVPLEGSMAEYRQGPLLTDDDIAYYWSQYLDDPERQQNDPRVSPAKAASHTGLPAAFIATAECDPTRDDSERYGQILAEAGVAVEARRYAGMPHGFVSWLAFVPAARQAMDDACAFLRARWGQP